jgi:hypothetical protein
VTIPALVDGSGSEAPVTSDAKPTSSTAETSVGTSTSDAQGKGSQGVIGLVVAGAGVVAIAAGGVMALGAKGDYDGVPAEQCNASNECDPIGYDARQAARDKAGVATIVMGVGGAALVGGGILWLTAPSRSRSGSASFGVGPSGMVLRGSF